MVTNKSYRKYTIIPVFLALYVILVAGLLYWIFKERSLVNESMHLDALKSPAIIIIPIVVGVFTFIVASAVFAALAKSKNTSAPGMPNGTGKMFVALPLITLFFVLAAQPYSAVSGGSVGKSAGIKATRLNALLPKVTIYQEKTNCIKSLMHTKDSTVKDLPAFVYRYNISGKVPVSCLAGDRVKRAS